MKQLRQVIISDVISTTWTNRQWLTYDYFLVTTNPKTLKEAADHLASFFPEQANCIISPGMGALSLATAISLELLARGREVPVLVVRDIKRSRVGERLVQGVLPLNAVAVYVDDTIGSGATFEQTVATVRAVGGFDLAAILVILDPKSLYGSRRLKASGIPIYSCFTKHDVGAASDDVGMACGEPRRPLVKGLLWRLDLTGIGLSFAVQASVPLWVGDDLLIGDNTHTLARVGEPGVHWKYQTKLDQSKGLTQDFLLVGDSVVLGGYSGTVASVRLDDGHVNWETKCGRAVHATPVLHRGLLYVVGEDCGVVNNHEMGTLTVMDLKGIVQYTTTFADRWSPGTPAVTDELTIVTANDGVVRGLSTQEQVWSYQLEGKVWGSLLEEDGRIYAADDVGWVYCLTLQGEEVWKQRVSSSFLLARPIIRHGLLIVSDSNIYTHALDLHSGKRIWISKTRSQIPWRPIDVDVNTAILLGQDGDASLIELSSGRKLRETKINLDGAYIRQPGGYQKGKLAVITTTSQLMVFELDLS